MKRSILLFDSDAFKVLFSCIKIESIIFFYDFLMQATSLLQKNLDNARASLEVLIADLQFLRDQVTITQVL